MTREYLRWKAKEDWMRFSCFTIGCYEEATHIVRIEFGPALVQLCLCGDCSDEPPDSIISGVATKQKFSNN